MERTVLLALPPGDDRRACLEALEAAGICPMTAATAVEARRLALSERPHVVITSASQAAIDFDGSPGVGAAGGPRPMLLVLFPAGAGPEERRSATAGDLCVSVPVDPHDLVLHVRMLHRLWQAEANARKGAEHATERRRAEEALRDSEERLRLAVAEEALKRSASVLEQAGRMAKLGAWHIDLVNRDDLNANTLQWSDQVFRIFGYEPGQVVVTNDLFFRHVHPGDRDRVVDAVARALTERREYSVEHRIIRADGCLRWVLEHADVECDAENHPIRLTGAVQDVTQAKQAEESLRQREKLLRFVVDSSPDNTFIQDRHLRYVWVGRPAHPLTTDEYVGRTDHDLFTADEAARLTEIKQSVLTEGSRRTVEVCLTTKGEPHVYDATYEPWRDPAGRIVGVAGYLRDITDRKRAEEALREANERLADADRRKDEFIAILSHELRNPLAPIRYALPVLERESLGDGAGRAVAVIERQVAHLARLVDDLLDVSRITRGKIELRRERVGLAAVVGAALEAASPLVWAACHSLETSITDEPVWLHADAARIAQVISNLLDNSAKYTPRGGRILVEARREEADAVIRVRDNGAGIRPEELPTIFEMFRQVNGGGSAKGGLGIGLGLVKRLVEMHGGTIEAHSDGPGQGAEFVVRLPAAPAPEPRAVEDAPKPGSGRSLKVLIVDDNADLVEMLAIVVEGAGHDVRRALDGASALSAAFSYKPDVVLLDLGLPVVDGLEVARELRRHPDTSAALLIALTGWGQAEDRRRTEEAGFDAHLTKPTDPSSLERLLSEFASHPSP